jgi:hypothetical protein
MGKIDMTTGHSPGSSNHDQPHDAVSVQALADGGGRREPLFKRFAVAKEWRAKDMGAG